MALARAQRQGQRLEVVRDPDRGGPLAYRAQRLAHVPPPDHPQMHPQRGTHRAGAQIRPLGRLARQDRARRAAAAAVPEHAGGRCEPGSGSSSTRTTVKPLRSSRAGRPGNAVATMRTS